MFKLSALDREEADLAALHEVTPHSTAINVNPHSTAMNATPHSTAISVNQHTLGINDTPYSTAINVTREGPSNLIPNTRGYVMHNRPQGPLNELCAFQS